MFMGGTRSQPRLARVIMYTGSSTAFGIGSDPFKGGSAIVRTEYDHHA
jgi:hypothetical protein